MGLEIIVCPNCGRATLGNVPNGHKLLRVAKGGKSYQESFVSENGCSKCGVQFVTETIEIEMKVKNEKPV